MYINYVILQESNLPYKHIEYIEYHDLDIITYNHMMPLHMFAGDEAVLRELGPVRFVPA